MIDPTHLQYFAALALPLVVQFFKKLIPTLAGRWLLVANLALNLLVAAGVAFGLGAPATTALAVGAGGGLMGSKIVDIFKHGATSSPRHRR